jgi:magnesium-transporting ATPase (P-type)
VSCCPFFYYDVNNAGSVCVFIGDNMLTAVSVARDCGIIPLGQQVVVAHGLSGYSGEPTQLLYTNANNNNMPSPLSAVSFLLQPLFSFFFLPLVCF